MKKRLVVSLVTTLVMFLVTLVFTKVDVDQCKAHLLLQLITVYYS